MMRNSGYIPPRCFVIILSTIRVIRISIDFSGRNYILKTMLPNCTKDAGPGARPVPLRKGCLLHWEITNKCRLACKFCYRGRDIPPDDLSYGVCIRILDNFCRFLQDNNFTGSIIFSGGDPLLREDLIDIIKVAHNYQNKGIIGQMTVSGNPDMVNAQTASALKYNGVSVYQMSIDGLEATHDFFRKPGSFRQTLAALKCIKDAGLKDSVKFTLSRINANELVEAMRLLLSEGVSFVHFSQLVPVGDGKNLEKEVLTSSEYRAVLLKMLEFLDALPQKQAAFRQSTLCNEPLFGRLFYEQDRWDEYQKFMSLPQPLTACGKGLVFSVLPDGQVRVRRFIPAKVGQVPDDSFQKIYDSSALVKSLEDDNYNSKRQGYKKCLDCPVLSHCGNMVADAYYFTEDPCGPNPKCWV